MVDGFSCIVDFRTPPPPYKGNTSIKPSKSFFNNNSSQRQKKEPEKISHAKTIYRKFILGYTEIEKKEQGAGARSFLCDV